MCEAVKDAEKVGEFQVVRLSRRNFMSSLAASSMMVVVPGCTTNPETGKSQFILVSDAQLAQMASASWAQAKRDQKTLNGTSYNRKLQSVGSRIARGAGRANQPWEYAVFDSDTKNAFVMPGNKVGFYRGMMDFVDNDDQLAAIMGHEVGHVSGRHAAERVSQQMAGQVAVAGGTLLTGSQLNRRCNQMIEAYRPGGYTAQERAAINNCRSQASRNTQMMQAALGAGLMLGIILPYSRKHELEADLLGAKYMHTAGYNPMQSVRLWEKMARDNPSRGPSFLSTHPDPAYRAKNLDSYIRQQGWA